MVILPETGQEGRQQASKTSNLFSDGLVLKEVIHL